MPATWIADALRAGGCTVNETVVPDWKARGHTDGPRVDTVVGVMGHHTAGGATGNLPSLATVRDGRSDLAGPLANLMLARDGTWVPIAAGRCWHAGAADKPALWPWIPNGDANGYCLGIEAESAGTGDWTPAQLTAYPQGAAALLKYRGLPAGRFLGHKEWAPSRKPDPHGWPGDMAGFRSTVANLLNGADVVTPQDIQAIAAAVWQSVGDPAQGGSTWIADRIIAIDNRTGQILTIATQARDAATGANTRAGDGLTAINTQVVPKLGGSVTVDPAALAAALLADEASVAKLGDAIAAGLAKRVGNG
jgi:hypothetical protein